MEAAMMTGKELSDERWFTETIREYPLDEAGLYTSVCVTGFVRRGWFASPSECFPSLLVRRSSTSLSLVFRSMARETRQKRVDAEGAENEGRELEESKWHRPEPSMGVAP